MRHKLNREKPTQLIGNLPKCGMEACPDSQHLAPAFQGSGHDVRIIAPKFIEQNLKSEKNDFNDAEAIAEAVRHPTMRLVTVKFGRADIRRPKPSWLFSDGPPLRATALEEPTFREKCVVWR
jgi:transposase